MGLKLVIERECSRDHQTALRQFLCCEPGGPEWAMDPQRYIRDLSVRKTPKGIMRTLLVVSGDIPLHDDVVGFCEYGVAVETTDEHEGVYQISYIATALKVRGTHLGDTLLSSVIVRLRDDACLAGLHTGIVAHRHAVHDIVVRVEVPEVEDDVVKGFVRVVADDVFDHAGAACVAHVPLQNSQARAAFVGLRL